MLRIKRVWWAVAVIFVTLFLPSTGYSLERDPYLRRNLLGSITFEYERYRSENANGAETEANTFRQIYSLDVKGNMFSRALMIYDLGVSWDSTNYNTDASELTSTSLTYYGRTTLLPLSRIPFTLYANRNTNSLSGGANRETNTTTYGFSWLLDFLYLPTTRMSLEKRNIDGPDQNQDQLFGTLNLEKELGPSKTTVDYKYRKTNNEESAEPETAEITEHTVNARSAIDISRTTKFGASMTYNTEIHPLDDTEDQTIMGISVDLSSKPGRDFSQSHSYSYYRADQGPEEGGVGHSYSGDMNYDISSRMSSSLSLFVENIEDATDPSTTDFTTETIYALANFRYRITDNLRFTETVSYYNSETSAMQASTLNLGKRRTFRVVSGLDYTRKLGWANANAGYAIGYTEDEAEEGSGNGIEQRAYAGLMNIDVNPYVIFSTYGDYYYLEGVTGPIWERKYSYNAEAYNKVGRDYVDVSAKYSKVSEGGWLEEITNRNRDRYGIFARSTYFEKTTLAASAEQSKTTQELSGTSQITTLSLSASHRRQLLGGRLTLLYGYFLRLSDSEVTSDRTTTTRYLGEYEKTLRFNVAWTLRVTREEEKVANTTDTFSNTTTISNALRYRLRAWRFTLEHDYEIIETSSLERTDNTLFLRATRRFFRFF